MAGFRRLKLIVVDLLLSCMVEENGKVEHYDLWNCMHPKLALFDVKQFLYSYCINYYGRRAVEPDDEEALDKHNSAMLHKDQEDMHVVVSVSLKVRFLPAWPPSR